MQNRIEKPSMVIIPVDEHCFNDLSKGQKVFDLFVVKWSFDELTRILGLLEESYGGNISVSDAVGVYDHVQHLVGVRLYLYDFSVIRLLFWLGYHWEDALIPMP